MEDVLALLLGGIVLMTPIVWILTKHQQKMTQLLHEDKSKQALPASQDLAREMSELRHVVHQQTIALDSLAKSQAELKSALLSREDLTQRIG
jgi:hypothetical protein